MNFFESSRTGREGRVEEPPSAYAQVADPMATIPDTTRVLRVLWLRKWHILACSFFAGLTFFMLAARQSEQFKAEATVLLDPREYNLITAETQVVADLDLTTATVESEVARIASFSAIHDVVKTLGYAHLQSLDAGVGTSSGLLGVVDWLKKLLAPENANRQSLISSDNRALLRIVHTIAQGTSVSRIGNSFVVKLQVTTVNPVLSAEVVNLLTERYITKQVSERKTIAAKASQWHEELVETQRLALTKADLRVEAARRQYAEVFGASSEVLTLQLTELAKARAGVQANLSAAKARLDTLELSIQKSGIRSVAMTMNREPFLSLLAEEEKLRQAERQMASEFGEHHRERTNIRLGLQQLDKRLADSVKGLKEAHENEIGSLSTSERSLGNEVDLLQAQILDDMASSRQLRQFEIEAKSARESYEKLVGRLADVRAQSELQLPDARVLSLAQIPTGPSAPRPKFMAFFGICIGASIGFFSVLILEALGRGVLSREEFMRLTDHSAVCVLPQDHLKSSSEILTRLKSPKRAPIAERLRQMKMLLSHQTSSTSQVILLVSARPKEGRSTIALALSHLHSEAGKKTLLISSDAPAAQVNDLEETQGGAFDCKEINELLCEGAYSSLSSRLQEMQKNYDTIVIDGRPLLEQSGSLRFVEHADLIVFIAEFSRTPKRAITSCLDLLQNLGAKPALLVLNKSDLRLDPDSHVIKSKFNRSLRA